MPSTRTVAVEINCQENSCGSCSFCTNYFVENKTVTKRCIIFNVELKQTSGMVERAKICKDKEM
jgi:hypothetical protein